MNVITNSNLQCTVALAALHDVYDPEIGLNVADLGLIYQLDSDDEQKTIFCSMTLTTQFCPMGESITDGVKTKLQDCFADYEVDVELTFDPPWSYDKISEEGKNYLNR
ncbi:MAG TPA: metal-sulfur cluster assembly factor [Chitinophagaceae bacterium]|nr:metal-sulfur cluster assembly factor [Chitinophagaceae bacterium]